MTPDIHEELDDMYNETRRIDVMQDGEMHERGYGQVPDLDDEMGMSGDLGNDMLSSESGYDSNDGHDGSVMGPSLADEFGMDLDMELQQNGENGEGLGNTLAGELGGGLGGSADPASFLSSLTTSPDPDPRTPPNQHLSLPAVSPSFPSGNSSPGQSHGADNGIDADADGEYPSMTSTRYYTAYSPGQMQMQSASKRKTRGHGRASTSPSLMADMGDVSTSLDMPGLGAEGEGDGDAMRDILEGKMRTEQMGAAARASSGTAGLEMAEGVRGMMGPAAMVSGTLQRYGPKLEKDPMVIIEQCMAESGRFLRALQKFNGPAHSAETNLPDDDHDTTLQTRSPTRLTAQISSHRMSSIRPTLAEDDALADYLHKLAMRERRMDDRQRELEKLTEKWEEARYGEGCDLDFFDLPSFSDPTGITGLPVPTPRALTRVKSSSTFTFSPPLAPAALLPLPAKSDPSHTLGPSATHSAPLDVPSHLPALISDPLPATLHRLSETLHAQSSALIATGRQLRAIRVAMNTAQEGLKNEEQALKGIEAWEGERVREGLRGGKRSDALKGLSEGLGEVWETEKSKWGLGIAIKA